MKILGIIATTPNSSDAFIPATFSSPLTLVSQPHHSFIIKLNSSNFLAWKTQFLPLLNCHNLQAHIDGGVPSPPKYITNPQTSQLAPNPAYND